ncbi:tyrosinase [Grosmannia clavigera kw1407]|uniref:Tyrosinase n=1 Tax=Grosmannia clavigera (strain kw1407 / UAMH 11150) TaxID=655863 RepID=F0XSM6_GROCL|nr:tyrosinase [Grosmannia clavigera kw1407]EFW99211.1 tyrosinase [Grosmannia clavigera kw1407]
MKVAPVFASTAGLLASVAAAVTVPSSSRDLIEDEITVKTVIADITDLFQFRLQLNATKSNSSCTPDKIVYRRAYGALSRHEKLDYIGAVKCLMILPSRTPANVSSGARSRFDDFVATHIQQTLTIHYSGNFMAWHRWFVYSYEKALRDECGYQGYQPYWDWPLYANATEDSPIFDGSDTSLGGNGDYFPHSGRVITAPAGSNGSDIQLPAGDGGGNVTTGAFANLTVNLGPVGGVKGMVPGPDGGLGYNPRTLTRDIASVMNMEYANYTTVLDLLGKANIDTYRALLEGIPNNIVLGPHGGIHNTIGGDPSSDLFASPGDPVFWLHHCQMDRMWALWQTLDPAVRHSDLKAGNFGHITWNNKPASRYTTLDDVIDLGYAAPSTTIRNVMDTTSGPFCYYYL